MWILQWYILREMLKAMALTSIGLTLVFTLGGGVANMVKGASIDSFELLQLLGFMLPVATTLTLPVAALLSTTNIYGRLAADNEFVACRAVGINIHRLLFSAVAVAVGVGTFTFYFSNYVIPGFVRQIESKARASVDQYVNRKLAMDKFIRAPGYVFHADNVQHIRAKKPGDKDYLRIGGAAFIELEGGDAIRFGTAPQAIIEFDKSDRLPRVRAQLLDVSIFDRVRLRYARWDEQPFGPMDVDFPIQVKLKWLNLPDLYRYRDAPTELPEIGAELAQVRRQIRQRICYDEIIRAQEERRDWRLGNEKVTYTLKPADEFRRRGENRQPELKGVTVIEDTREGLRTLRAGIGLVETTIRYGVPVPLVGIILSDGVIIEKEGEPNDNKLRQALKYVPIPDRCIRIADRHTDELAEAPDVPLSLGPRIEEAQERFRRGLGHQVRVIVGIIHARAGFGASCVVLIILGAGLGIVFRGGQALVSFGLSCIPFALVIVTIIMGRQLAQNEGTETIGLVILWAGIGVVALADVLVLFKWLRR